MTIATFFQNVETQAKAWAVKEYETVLRPLIAKEAAAFKPLVTATEEDVITYGVPAVLAFFGQEGIAIAGGAKMAAAVPTLINALGAVGKQIAAVDAQASLQIIVGQIKNTADALQKQLAAGG